MAGYTVGQHLGLGTAKAVLGVVLGSATGFVLGGVLGRQTATAVRTMEEELRRVPAAEVVAGMAGLVLGLAMSAANRLSDLPGCPRSPRGRPSRSPT